MIQEIDHRARAMRLHRRAQQAESVLMVHAERARFWMDRCQEIAANRRTLKKRLQRVRTQLTHARSAGESHLERIIRLGRLFP